MYDLCKFALVWCCIKGGHAVMFSFNFPLVIQYITSAIKNISILSRSKKMQRNVWLFGVKKSRFVKNSDRSRG